MNDSAKEHDRRQRYFIVCQLCGREFKVINWQHLRSVHGFDRKNRHPVATYKKMFRISNSRSHLTSVVTRRSLLKTLRRAGRRWSKTRIIETIRRRWQQGKALNYAEVEKTDPSLVSTAQRCFQGWATALRVAGLDPTNIRKKRSWTRAKVIDAIRNRNRQGKPMNHKEVALSDAALTGVALRRFGSWDTALRAAGLDSERIRQRRWWSPERITEAIRQRWARGEDMTNVALRKSDFRLLSASYAYFSTWGAALRAAGLDPDRYRKCTIWTNEKILATIRNLYRRYGKATTFVMKAAFRNSLVKAIYRRGWTIPHARALAGLPDHAPAGGRDSPRKNSSPTERRRKLVTRRGRPG